MKYKIVESITIPPNNTIGYFVINRNPYNTKIIIPKINGITDNYNDRIIGQNDFTYVSFTSTLLKETVINIGGVKYG